MFSCSPSARDSRASSDVWAGIQQTHQGIVQRWDRKEPLKRGAESSGALGCLERGMPLPWGKGEQSINTGCGTLTTGASKGSCSLSCPGHRSGVGLVTAKEYAIFSELRPLGSCKSSSNVTGNFTDGFMLKEGH